MKKKKLFWVQMYENKSPKQSTFTGNIALLPSDVMDFALLPAQRFWQETVSLLDVIRPQSNLWEHALLRKNFQLHNKNNYVDRGGCNVWVTHINYYYVLFNLSTFQIWLTPAGYYNEQLFTEVEVASGEYLPRPQREISTTSHLQCGE